MRNLSIILCSLLCVACQNPTEQQVSQISTRYDSTQVVKTAQTQDIWLDVRTPEEFAQGHLQSAFNVTSEQLRQQMPEIAPNKNTTIHVYCRSGRRSEQARQILLEMGYQNVINEGGYQDLLQKGLR